MQQLSPTLDQVSQEYVLVQAWKKSASYIRYHNWFSDTLDLDRVAADLPNFLARISDQIRFGEYETTALQLVPAPKSQRWQIDDKGYWQPAPLEKYKIRPLAHVALSDQVVATAILLCLNERVETAQGDPRNNYQSHSERKMVMSYGNRLFCDAGPKNQLTHRWGSSKLYRAYFQDYRSFLNRPESVAATMVDSDQEYLIIQTDLKQFYDRVTPIALNNKIRALKSSDGEDGFFDLASKVLKWGWHDRDQYQFELYKKRSKIPDCSHTALPQGLVAAGFFSNIVMLDFDRIALSHVGEEIAPGVFLHDICRYVDDIRLTITKTSALSPTEAEAQVINWITQILDQQCSGMQVSPEKTTTASVGSKGHPLVRQSRKMERIQTAISGGFDASGGEEVIHAIEGLIRSQASLSGNDDIRRPLSLRSVSDVKDETVGRFAAGRFRKTFRSLRPLLDDRPFMDIAITGDGTFRLAQLSQTELDEEAHAFALTLIQKWIADPSNVRLLRVALDLWPSPEVLKEVINLFGPYLSGKIRLTPSRQIAYYCLAEILRAGATETGFVDDTESLPANVDLQGYRKILLKTARKIADGEAYKAPWYLIQQALLYVSVHDPLGISLPKQPKSNRMYWLLIAFLQGEHERLSDREFATFAIIGRRSFLTKDAAVKIVSTSLTSERLNEIAARDIEFANALFQHADGKVPISSAIAEDMGVTSWSSVQNIKSLQQVVQTDGPLNPLRNEIGVLTFAKEFLQAVVSGIVPPVVTPSTIQVSTNVIGKYASVTGVQIRSAETSKGYKSVYSAPAWVEETQRWRFQLGYLLRFILTAEVDFSLPVRPQSRKEAASLYRPTRGHWLQRQYGFYNGHEAFGDDWVPISQFTQELLFSLLIWPGCRTDDLNQIVLSLDETISRVDKGVSDALEAIGSATGVLMLKVGAPMHGTQKDGRPLRACVVQSIMPEAVDLVPDEKDLSTADLQIQNPVTRRKHRQHLSAALAAVEKMLDLRETHKPENKRLDWLILPELSIHPDDVATHLIPFARAFKTAILAGVGYEQVVAGQPLVNSALWVIPQIVSGKGLQIVIRRQGKQHLSPMETPFNDPIERVAGFRPCQWLVGYEWSLKAEDEPLWLSAAVCYDATDLKLASDLKDRSDVFAIPALNRDVGTFDQMAQALHYHMFQLVIVANNGSFGGSNAYVPRGETSFVRQLFHTHGQPQATVSFFEIDNIEEMKSRHKNGFNKSGKWKYPPAGF